MQFPRFGSWSNLFNDGEYPGFPVVVPIRSHSHIHLIGVSIRRVSEIELSKYYMLYLLLDVEADNWLDKDFKQVPIVSTQVKNCG